MLTITIFAAQLAQKEAQLLIANQLHSDDVQRISTLRADLAQQHTELNSLQNQLEAAKEREMASSVAADLDNLLDDPDQMPAEVQQLMSSLRREQHQPMADVPAKLQHLQQQLQRKETEMQERDAAMQQLLRGADRIEDVQKETLKQLSDSQSEVELSVFISIKQECRVSLGLCPAFSNKPFDMACKLYSTENLHLETFAKIFCFVAHSSMTQRRQ